jgi:hypothetical protein
MLQTDDCVIQVHGHKMSTAVFIFKVFDMLLQYKLG